MTKSSADISLYPREVEVCRMAVNGLSNRDIAEALGIDHTTVKVHLRNAFKKLGIHRRLELCKHYRPEIIPKSNQTDFDGSDENLLDLIAEGRKDHEIADILSKDAVEETTTADVRVAVARLRRRTGIGTRNAMAIWWLDHTDKLGIDETLPESV